MNLQKPLYHQLTHVAAVFDLENVDGRITDTPALRKARRLARKTQSALTLLAFAPEPTLADNLAALITRSDSHSHAADHKTALFELAESIQRQDDVSVHCEIRNVRFNASNVNDWLMDSPCDLLVICRPEKTSSTIIADRFSPIIRETNTPVWFAGSGSDPRQGVVAAITSDSDKDTGPDLSLDDDVLDVARGLVDLFDSDLHVVQASPKPEPVLASSAVTSMAALAPQLPTVEDISAQRNRRLAEQRGELQTFIERAGGVDGELLVMEGDVATAVSAGAEVLDAGLIVMGASSKSRWASLLLGGAAEATLAISPCDLLLVKPAEREAAQPNALLSHAAMQSTTEELHEVDLLVNPRRYFHTPAAVLREDGLSQRDKKLILCVWEEELANEARNETAMPQQVFEPVTNPAELTAVRESLGKLEVREAQVA